MSKRLPSGLACVCLTLLGFTPVRAEFVIDPTPGGQKFFNGNANKNVSLFGGTVGGQHSGPMVVVNTFGSVNTGAGFATIKPVKGGTLTTLTFTPADGNLFADFSFRGQLLNDAKGTVVLTVQDNQGHAPETFTFTGLGKNKDFGRIGIVATPGSGSTIRSVTLTSSFKEEKQNEFSLAPFTAVVPEPATVALLGLGSLGLAGFVWRRRRRVA